VAILEYICICPLSGTFLNVPSFYEHELKDLIEELILKVWRMQDTDLNKFNKLGFIFSDLVYLEKHLKLGFFRKNYALKFQI